MHTEKSMKKLKKSRLDNNNNVVDAPRKTLITQKQNANTVDGTFFGMAHTFSSAAGEHDDGCIEK